MRRIRWPLEAKIKIYALVKNMGTEATRAFRIVADEYNCRLTKSYYRSPQSHIYRFGQLFQKAVDAGNAEVIRLLHKYNLLEK